MGRSWNLPEWLEVKRNGKVLCDENQRRRDHGRGRTGSVEKPRLRKALKEEIVGRDNMQKIIVDICAIIMPTLLGYVVWLLKNQKKDRDANSKGTMLLLRVQLIEYHEKWTERGYITKHGLENFIEMYDAYHSLGGNGMVTKLLEEIKKLPIRD